MHAARGAVVYETQQVWLRLQVLSETHAPSHYLVGGVGKGAAGKQPMSQRYQLRSSEG